MLRPGCPQLPEPIRGHKVTILSFLSQCSSSQHGADTSPTTITFVMKEPDLETHRGQCQQQNILSLMRRGENGCNRSDSTGCHLGSDKHTPSYAVSESPGTPSPMPLHGLSGTQALQLPPIIGLRAPHMYWTPGFKSLPPYDSGSPVDEWSTLGPIDGPTERHLLPSLMT